VTFDLQEYETWKETYSGLPHMIPFLRVKRIEILERMRERMRRERTRIFMESSNYERNILGGGLS